MASASNVQILRASGVASASAGASARVGGALVAMSEVRNHNKESDCWVVLHGQVYNLTAFLNDHPGGSTVISTHAGKDATLPFDEIHPKDIVRLLPPSAHIGPIDQSTITPADIARSSAVATNPAPTFPAPSAAPVQAQSVVPWVKPPLDHMLNVNDFAEVAARVMKKDGWDYYQSAADDEITLYENHAAFQRIWLRPRILVDVSKIDTTALMLGTPVAFPLYCTATALAKLAHPEGELAIVRAAHARGLIYMLPTLSSCSQDDMLQARAPSQPLWYQLYVNPNRQLTAEVVQRAEAGGCSAMAITVDAPQLGRRERDMRNKFHTANSAAVQKQHHMQVKKDTGVSAALSSFIDPSLNWSDLPTLRKLTKMKIMLKGVQCGEDAVLAAQHGVDAIILSNHGGRQVDTARSGIEILPEVMSALRASGLEKRMEVYVDGGVRRGTDIFKALALGAKGVGLGRPILYGLAGYGQAGVERVLELMQQEFSVCMAMMGCRSLADIRPEMVIVDQLGAHTVVDAQMRSRL